MKSLLLIAAFLLTTNARASDLYKSITIFQGGNILFQQPGFYNGDCSIQACDQDYQFSIYSDGAAVCRMLGADKYIEMYSAFNTRDLVVISKDGQVTHDPHRYPQIESILCADKR